MAVVLGQVFGSDAVVVIELCRILIKIFELGRCREAMGIIFPYCFVVLCL